MKAAFSCDMYRTDCASSAHYLATVQGYAVLSREQELALVRSWRDHNDERARDLLVRSMLRHVVTIARRYQRYGYSSYPGLSSSPYTGAGSSALANTSSMRPYAFAAGASM